MPRKKQPTPIQQTAIGDGNVQIVGDQNIVNQTIIQKIFNIFRSDAETIEQRNRRIMLGHVENFWVKGILEKSLYGAALLELGIKEAPDALVYPWAIKREATKETLPAGTSMLKIFREIGMGRSLLILGAPGSGKTTMLLELTRQLIERVLDQLSPAARLIITLLEIEDRPVKEISRLTGWSVPLVKVRAFRARTEMRRLLGKIAKEKYL